MFQANAFRDVRIWSDHFYAFLTTSDWYQANKGHLEIAFFKFWPLLSLNLSGSSIFEICVVIFIFDAFNTCLYKAVKKYQNFVSV